MDLIRQQMRDLMKKGMDAAAKALGLSASDLRSQLRSGTSLKDIAAAKNVDFAKVQSAMSDAVKPQLDQAVQSGSLSATQAADWLAKLTSGDAPAKTAGSQRTGGHHGHGKLFKAGMDAAAKALGVSSSDLMSQLRSGTSLKDIAAAKNVDLAKVQSAISDAVKPQLDQAVQGGRLSSDQAAALLARLTSGEAPNRAAGGASSTYSLDGSSAAPLDPGQLVNAAA
jgi:ribosomal protein S20